MRSEIVLICEISEITSNFIALIAHISQVGTELKAIKIQLYNKILNAKFRMYATLKCTHNYKPHLVHTEYDRQINFKMLLISKSN